MRQRPTVSFVIPVKNDAARLRRCLMSIQRNPGAADDAEILVVDNGSTDGSALVAFEAGARVLKLPGLAVAALRNEAASQATGELLALVDADHEIDAGWLASAVHAMQQPAVGAVGAPYHSPNVTWVQRAYDGLRSRSLQPCDVEWLGSGNLVVRRDLFVELGGFDTTLDTCEDVDFCRRLRERGYRLVSDRRLRSVHHGDPATLSALFRSELWRGRDNLKASLRGKITPRELPSIAIPFLDLLLMLVAAVSVATLSRSGLIAGATAMGMVFALASIRTAVMMRRLHRAPLGGIDVFVVALVYDAARAFALVARAGHEVRRRA